MTMLPNAIESVNETAIVSSMLARLRSLFALSLIHI